MASSSDVGIIVRSCGIIVGTTRVNRMIDFCNLLRVLSDITGLDLNLYSLKVSSVCTNGNVSSRIPINNNGDLGFFFHPNAGFNSVELLVESEILVNPQAPNNAWKNQYYKSVRSGHDGGNYTNVGPSNTNYSVMHKTVIDDLSGDHFWTGDPSKSEASDNGSSDEGLSDGDDNAEEQMPTNPNLLTTPCFESSYKNVPIGSICNSSGCPIYNADNGILKIGMVFRDKEHLQSAVKDHSVRYARREYKVVGNSRANWKIVCKQNPANEIGYCTKHKHCQWCLCATFTRNHWVIIQLGPPHSCFKNLCKNLLAADLESKVQIEPTYEVKFVMEHALARYNYTLSYQEAWQTLKRAREKVFGTWESSCQYLPKFMGALQKYNPGTIVKWRHKNGNDEFVHTLGYVFWAFRPCVEAFRHCRKILTVGGTYLHTKYKHRLLIANTIDAEQKIISVAYAIVDEENFQSWYWFLQMLATHVVRDVEGVCLISDRHKSILKAIEYVPAFHPPRGVHRYCLRHITSDFHTQFKSVGLKDLCYKAGRSLTFRYFELTMDEIGRLNHDAYEYLRSIDPRKWTFCHDGGNRFGIMTTNISEAINGVLKGIRRLPISAIVNATFTRSKNAFLKRGEAALKLQQKNQSWPDNILYLLDTHRQVGMKHHVDLYNYSRQTASVANCVEGSMHHHHHHRVFTVSLTEQECSCGQWKLDRIPCPHAMEVCRQYGVNPAMYVPYCYSTNAYVTTYSSGIFVPLPEEEEWDEPCFQMKHNPDCRIRRRGRDVTSEIRVQDKVGPSHQGCTSHHG